MRIDGKEIRDILKNEIRGDVARAPIPLRLAVVSVGEDPVARSFVNIKKRCANDLGVIFSERSFPRDSSFPLIQETIQALNEDITVTGIIVQLPLPLHLDTPAVLELISPLKDVDVLSPRTYKLFAEGEGVLLPPVVSAIAEICRRGRVDIRGHNVVVLGNGRLVGAPAGLWFRREGARVSVFDKSAPPSPAQLLDADIVVCGMGHAGYIKPEMLKRDVVLIDAGTSESAGVIVGDADPRCEEIASIFTPVPGGVGPITVAMIFKNLVILSRV